MQARQDGTGGAMQTVVKDYADVMEEAELTWNRLDHPGKLVFTCLEENGISIPEGSSVELYYGAKKMFKGYVFIAERNRDGEVEYTAYDQMRYLTCEDSFAFENMTVGQIIQLIAEKYGLAVGQLEDTGYALPVYIKESESCLDMIFGALTETIIQTGKIFLFYDDCGKLTLTEAKNLYISKMLGGCSLVTDYTYKRDIDSDTYNRVKLVRKNEKSGRTDVYIHEDTDSISQWGLLQYYEEVDENLNEAQIDEMCQNYLKYYNRVLQTLELEAIGMPEVRAGSILPVCIGAVDVLKTPRLLLVEKVTHKFETEVHTMEIEVKSFEQLGGADIV